MIDNAGIEKIKEFVKDSDKIIIIPHHNPDGDAIGASLALYGVLIQKGKEVNVVSPNSFPEFLGWMPGANKVISYEADKEKATELLKNANLLFFLDFNDLSRAENGKCSQ